MTIADTVTQIGIEDRRPPTLAELRTQARGVATGVRRWAGLIAFSPSGGGGGTKASPAAVQTVKVQEVCHYDLSRTLRWSLCGVILHGPYISRMFQAIERLFGPAQTMSHVLKKTMTAQFVGFPPFVVCLFAYLGAMEQWADGKGPFDLDTHRILHEKIIARGSEAFVTGCAFWPCVNIVNFSFVPAGMRVPYVSSCGCVWNMFLSWLNARGGGASTGGRASSSSSSSSSTDTTG